MVFGFSQLFYVKVFRMSPILQDRLQDKTTYREIMIEFYLWTISERPLLFLFYADGGCARLNLVMSPAFDSYDHFNIPILRNSQTNCFILITWRLYIPGKVFG